MVDVTAWEQPDLFSLPSAIRVRFEALIDPETETVVLVVEGVTFPARKVVALHSSSPVPWGDCEKMARDLGAVFTALLRHHTPPFR